MWEWLRHDSQGSQANGGDGTDTDTLEYKADHGILSNHTCQATGKYERRENLLKEGGGGCFIWACSLGASPGGRFERRRFRQRAGGGIQEVCRQASRPCGLKHGSQARTGDGEGGKGENQAPTWGRVGEPGGVPRARASTGQAKVLWILTWRPCSKYLPSQSLIWGRTYICVANYPTPGIGCRGEHPLSVFLNFLHKV